MYHKILSKGVFTLAAMAGIFAMCGWAVEDIWLASTQWMQIATLFVVMAIYIRISEEDDENDLRNRVRLANKSKKEKTIKTKKHASFRLTE